MESNRHIRESNLAELVEKGIKGRDAIELQRISRSLHKSDENSCNYGLTTCQEKREENLEKKAQEIATRYNMTAYHQGDPRGWSLYLVTQEQLDKAKERGSDIHSMHDRGIAVCPH
jgi:broad specificity polyphosphatase/5'/3'-nucleotidase SurE